MLLHLNLDYIANVDGGTSPLGINRSTAESLVYVYTNYVSRYTEVGCMTITTDLFGSETRDGRTISEGRRDACNSRDKNICTCISVACPVTD